MEMWRGGKGSGLGLPNSTLTSLRVSSGGTVQMGLSARCRYSISAAVGEADERDPQDRSIGGIVCFARGSLYKGHWIPSGQQHLQKSSLNLLTSEPALQPAHLQSY